MTVRSADSISSLRRHLLLCVNMLCILYQIVKDYFPRQGEGLCFESDDSKLKPLNLSWLFWSLLYPVVSWESETTRFSQLADVKALLADKKAPVADDESPFLRLCQCPTITQNRLHVGKVHTSAFIHDLRESIKNSFLSLL